jgi:TolA-binding protein
MSGTRPLIPANTTLLQPGSQWFRIADALNSLLALTAPGSSYTPFAAPVSTGGYRTQSGPISASPLHTLAEQEATLEAKITELQSQVATLAELQAQVVTAITERLNNAGIT